MPKKFRFEQRQFGARSGTQTYKQNKVDCAPSKRRFDLSKVDLELDQRRFALVQNSLTR